MKTSVKILIFGCLLGACKEKDMPAKYLSNINVIRHIEKKNTPAAPKIQPTDTLRPTTPSMPYHIIVASFKETDKASAQKMVDRLKGENHPASLLYSSGRYRVSIDRFPSETKATAALDKYRAITNRQDIWIHKIR